MLLVLFLIFLLKGCNVTEQTQAFGQKISEVAASLGGLMLETLGLIPRGPS